MWGVGWGETGPCTREACPHPLCRSGQLGAKLRPPLKTSLFPVQRMAIIVASRAATKSFSFSCYIFLSKKFNWLRKRETKYPNQQEYILTRPLHRKQTLFKGWHETNHCTLVYTCLKQKCLALRNQLPAYYRLLR